MDVSPRWHRIRIAIRLAAALGLIIPALPSAAQEYRVVPGLRMQAANASHPAEIGTVSSVVQLSNGSIVIADNINLRLHFFTASGRFVRSVGRDGAGPGEFKSVRWVGECSRDSVFAFDYMQSRISVFASDGTLARTFAVPAAQSVIVRCSEDGTMAYVNAGDIIGTKSYGVVQTYGRDGKLLFRSGNLLLDEGRPLGKSMKLSVGDGNIIFGAGDSTFVTWQTSQGTARKKLPAGIAGRVPTDLNRRSAMEYWVNYLRGGPDESTRTRQFLNSLPPVKELPAYTDLFLDGVSRAAWVQTSAIGDPATILQRLGPDGSTQGRATLPPYLVIQQIRGDVVVAKMTNAITGDESVVTYRLVAPAR